MDVLSLALQILDFSQLTSSQGISITGGVGDYLGILVASAGDINGDGCQDILISGNQGITSLILLYGGSDLTANTVTDAIPVSNGTSITSNSAIQAFSTVGGVDHDGYSDTMITDSIVHVDWLLYGSPTISGDIHLSEQPSTNRSVSLFSSKFNNFGFGAGAAGDF